MTTLQWSHGLEDWHGLDAAMFTSLRVAEVFCHFRYERFCGRFETVYRAMERHSEDLPEQVSVYSLIME